VELMGETILFAPRKAIKSQVLADFVAEWVDTQLPTALIQPELWTMYFDGSLMKTGAGAGLLFISSLGKHVRYVLRLHFPASNNVAEYEALVNGLRITVELGVQRLDARTCNISTEESYPSTRPKLGDWLGEPSRSSYWVMKRSSTTVAPQAFSNDAYPSPKDKSCCKRYTRGLAVTMQHLEPSSKTLSDKVSTGRPRWPTPLGLYAPAKGVNSTQDRRTCSLRPCIQYPSPGRLPCGVWTSSVPCRRHPGASRTCWSPSTNSPSGSRSDP
jgi:hypothetical protein